MRRVLFITYYFPPSVDAGAKRALGFYRHLREHGWEPLVLTVAGGNYATSPGDTWEDAADVRRCAERRFPWVREGSAGRASSEAARPSLGGLLTRRLVRAWLYVPDAFRGFHAPALAAARKVLEETRCDAILTSSSPFTLLRTGAALARWSGLPWVADLRDLWLDHHFGYPHGALRRQLDERLERRWLSRARAVVTTTEGQAEKLGAKGLSPPVRVVRNGFLRTPGELRDLAQNPPAREDDTFRVTFTGKVYEGRRHSVAPFLDALDILREEAPQEFARVHADFYGRVDSSFRAEVVALGLEDHVTDHGLVSREVADRALVRSDVGLAFVERNQTEIVATKMYDYLGALQPVLFLGPTQGEAARVLRECGGGATFDRRRPERMARWLLERLRAARPEVAAREEMASRVERFSYASLAGELSAVLDEAVG